MSDPRYDAHLEVGQKTYTLRFTNSALQYAEKLSGKTIQQLFVLVASAQFGFADLGALVTAGLEGARRKYRYGGKPWTQDRVADLLDDVDDFDAMAVPVQDAFEAALKKWFPSDEPAEDDEQDPQTAAGDGTTSSEPPSE